MDYTERAARDLRAREPYITAVLPNGERPAQVYSDSLAGDEP